MCPDESFIMKLIEIGRSAVCVANLHKFVLSRFGSKNPDMRPDESFIMKLSLKSGDLQFVLITCTSLSRFGAKDPDESSIEIG